MDRLHEDFVRVLLTKMDLFYIYLGVAALFLKFSSIDSRATVFTPHVVEGIMGEILRFSLEFQTMDNDSMFTVMVNGSTMEVFRISQNQVEFTNTSWVAQNDVILDAHGERCRVNITIRNLQFPVHEGYYQATISGTDGKDMSRFYIRTIANPRPLQIQIQPTSLTIGDQNNVILTCSGNTGRPAPIVVLLQSAGEGNDVFLQVGLNEEPNATVLANGTYFVNVSFSRPATLSNNGSFFICDIRYRIGLSQRLSNATSNRVQLLLQSNGQNSVQIQVNPPMIRLGQNDLRITCSATGNYDAITFYSLAKNETNGLVNPVVEQRYSIPTSSVTTTWIDTNLQSRANLSGVAMPSSTATMVIMVPKDRVRCPTDAVGYRCEFSAIPATGGSSPETRSDFQYVQITTPPSGVQQINIQAELNGQQVPTSDINGRRVFAVGTVLTLSCTAEVGSGMLTQHWCHKRSSDFAWDSPAFGVSHGEVTPEANCQYSRVSTYIHNVTSNDDSRMFTCEIGGNSQCGFGDFSSNITIYLSGTGQSSGQTNNDGGSGNAGVIAGAVIGSIAGLVVIILIVYFVIFRRRADKTPSQSGTSSANGGVIAGAVIGSLAGVVLIIVLLWCFVFRDRTTGQTYKTKEEQEGRNGQPEGPVYSIPHGKKRPDHGDRGHRYAVENKGLDEPHEDRPHRRDGRGHYNPNLSGDEDGDVPKRARSIDDMATGSQV